MSPTDPTSRAGGRPPALHLAMVLLVCALVYWPLLGATGLTSTEGHRVIPGWEMMETGDYLVTRMFDQIYLRKPPGMPWAVALSSSIFGQTEFAPRAVSALAMTSMALLTTFFAARWFGRRWSLWGGLAAALMPVLWSTGRAAEIEALNNFAAAAAVFLLIDLLIIQRAAPLRAQFPTVLAAAAAITLAALAKGPAAFAAIGMTIVASAVVLRSARVLLRPGLWIAAAIPAILFGALVIAIGRAVEDAGQTPVLQGVSDFLWSGRNLTLNNSGKVLVMGPSALVTALPASLALIFVWERSTGLEPGAPCTDPSRADQLARAIALTCILSLALLTAMGVQNPRYAQPSLVFLPVLVAYIARGTAGMFNERRLKVARAFLPARGLVWLAVLLAAAIYYIGWHQHHQRSRSSGREAGIALAEHLPAGAIVWADQLIEARPEVLLYARRAAAAQGRDVTIRWIPDLARRLGADLIPPVGTCLALRTDDGADEHAAVLNLPQESLQFERLAAGRVHKFDFVLLAVHDGTNPGE
jgi:4-amino-4-deoxy-L-arabinose transferase-like glycosyltransferase